MVPCVGCVTMEYVKGSLFGSVAIRVMPTGVFLTVETDWLWAIGGELAPNGRYKTCSPVLKDVPANAFACSVAVRSSFQARTSSISPIKKLVVGGVTRELAATLTGFVPELSGDAPEVDLEATCTPSIYRMTVEPPYVTTA